MNLNDGSRGRDIWLAEPLPLEGRDGDGDGDGDGNGERQAVADGAGEIGLGLDHGVGYDGIWDTGGGNGMYRMFLLLNLKFPQFAHHHLPYSSLIHSSLNRHCRSTIRKHLN
jgi:hypothetical protein